MTTKTRAVKPGLHVTTDGQYAITNLAAMGYQMAEWRVYQVAPSGALTDLLYITDTLADAKKWLG